MLNPDIKIAKSNGIDLPVMKVYLVGRISGNCMEKCVSWRKKIIDYYRNYKGNGSYPIAFICPLASGESKTADSLGLKSHLPGNLIYQKDLLSIEKSDVLVCNMDDFFEDGIEDILNSDGYSDVENNGGRVPLSQETLYHMFHTLKNRIENRRENFGSIVEFGIGLYLQKPIILIIPENRKYIYENHPFAKRASVIVTSVEQLLEEKWLQTLYKSMAGSIGQY